MNLPGAQQRSTTSRKEEIKNYAKRNSTVFITRDYTIIKLTRLSNFYINTAATQHTSQTQKNALRSVQSFLPLSHLVILLSQLLTNDRTTPYSTPLEAQKTAPLPVRSSIATTPYRSAARQMLDMCSDLQTHVIRQARIEVTAAYALNYLELRVLKPSELLQDFVYLRQNPRNFLSANIIALVGTVLYNAIKEYHNDGTRKTIHFHSHTVEDDHHDNDVDDILIKYTDDERQQYNTLIEDYNRAGKREDNILTEETRVQLRELSGEIHDILLREFHEANDFTESVTHNDDEQDEFAMLAEEYTIDNRIVHALALTKDKWELEPEDCDALVERYEEEINCSNLYSTV
ncbi:hypothetical protein HBI72_078740 [Parastagonospora nodorum]|nr:hypothetical protein HBI72_078740 [Parastagonospora nodorum]